MKKRITTASLALALLFSPLVSAHVVVKPATVQTGSFETFAVGVPNEKDIPTTSLRLVMPEGLQHVSVNNAPGWEVDIKSAGSGEEASVTEVTWQNGSIPAGFRESFLFSAKTPDTAGELLWKAYQTYQNGEIVAWDMSETGDGHSADIKPASVTKVVASADAANGSVPTTSTGNVAGLALLLSVAALGLGTFAVFRKK